MSDPTLASVIAKRDEERAAREEAQRLEAKNELLVHLAQQLDDIEQALKRMRERKAMLKGARDMIRAVADDEAIGVLELGEVVANVTETLVSGKLLKGASVTVVVGEGPRAGFAAGGYVNQPPCAPCAPRQR